MSEIDDKGHLMVFGIVLGALVFFTVSIMMMANAFSPSGASASDPLVAAQLKERLMPVGQSRIEQ